MPLFLIATPIGNLKDITLRALETLKEADLLACEDTRVTAKLLSHYGIRKPTISYNDHNAPIQRPQILDLLAQDKSVALISDAGTPLISDPGYKLVRDAAAAGHLVVPIPGPCAAIAGITVSGLPTDRFMFLGFLPAKAGERTRLLESFKTVHSSMILYESANRLEATLVLLETIWGDREACIARELTKLHEETRRGTLHGLAAHYAKAGAPKGEVVIVVGPPQEEEAVDEADIEKALHKALAQLSLKDAASLVAEQFSRPRKDIYSLALTLTKKP